MSLPDSSRGALGAPAAPLPPFKGQLKGHGLLSEGRVLKYHGWGSGEGSGRCSCGQESPVLPSTAARQRWHREHKATIAAGVTS